VGTEKIIQTTTEQNSFLEAEVIKKKENM